MRALIQRVKKAEVRAGGGRTAGINKGLLILLGVSRLDSEDDFRYLSKKIANLRVFEDNAGKMNLSVKDAGGSILSVPQFTLFADTKKGNRPGFEMSADPGKAKDLWKRFNDSLKDHGLAVEEGFFGSHMDMELVNDGPVTIWIDSGK
jgi:D-tyrosyl-tRNA(Tyr) deacylase